MTRSDWRWRANARTRAVQTNTMLPPKQLCTTLPPKIGLLLGLSAASIGNLAAQTAEPEKQEIVTLERYVVTGSNLRAPEGSMPVAVLTSANLVDGGVSTNLLEALRKQLPALSGGGNLGLSNAGTGITSSYGGSKIAIHNMATLVLVNGRRVANSGANGRGGSSFVDVSQIPLSAVDRVEVLSGGASAVYGSDAIGGVVNIILKQNFNGSELGADYFFSTADGHYTERQGWFNAGVSNDRVSVVVAGNYSKSDPLMQSERSIGNYAATGSFSGVVGSGATAMYLNSSYNSPRDNNPVGAGATAANMTALVKNGTYVSGTTALNLAPYVTMLAEQEDRSIYAGLTAKIFDKRLETFGDVLFSKNNTFSQLGAQIATVSVPAGAAYNPTTGAVSTVSFRYLPAPRQYRAIAELARFTGGLKGEISPSWSWETGYTYNRNKLTGTIANTLYSPNLDLAIRGGYDANGNPVAGGAYSRVYKDYAAPAVPTPLPTGYASSSAWLAAQRNNDNTVVQPALDPFARPQAVDPASLANVLGTSRADFTSLLDDVNVVVRGEPLQLPAGDLGLAVGSAYRTEYLKGIPDANSTSTGGTAQRWNGGSFFDRFSHGRFVDSGFAELQVPITSPKWNLDVVHMLTASLAYRLEKYSDAGTSRSPRYSAAWQPVDDEVTVRTSWSKGFAAPALYSLYGPTTQGFTTSLSSYLGYADGVNRQGTLYSGSNPNLRPTTSRSRSFGFDLKPKILKGLHLTFEYTDTALTDLVGTAGTTTIVQSVEQLGAASPYASQVSLGAPQGTAGAQAITGASQISAFLKGGGAPANIYVYDNKRNMVAAKVRTVDVTVDYTLPLNEYGQIEVSTAGTYFIDDKIQGLPTDPFFEYASMATANGSFSEGTIPPYRFYSTLGWKNGPWDVMLGNTYIPAVTDIAGGGSSFYSSTTLHRIKVASYLTWDAVAAYTFRFPKTWFAGFDSSVTLRAGINNLENKMPPLSTQAFAVPTYPNADTSTYSPVGRLYFVSTVLKF